MRRPLRIALLATLLSPMVVAAPAVMAAPPTPEPVAPSVQEVSLPALPPAPPGAKSGERPEVTTEELQTEEFSVVGVTWTDDEAVGDVAVAVRTRTDGEWTDWSPLGGEDDSSPDEGTAEEQRARAGTAPYWVGPSDGVQVRVAATGAAPQDLKVALVDPGTSDADATVTSTPGSTAAAAAPRPTIRSRAQWGADESIRRGSPSYASSISAATLHHTASSNSYTASQVPSIMRGFYAYHVQSRGWSDIGYNFLVDKFGTIWEGRAGGMDRPVIGAHAGGFNTLTTGISMIGTYESVQPTAAQLASVSQVVAWKLGMHGRDPQSSVTLRSAGSTRYRSGTDVTLPRVFGHIDVSTTSCPGSKGIAALPGIRAEAARIIANGGPSTPPPPENAAPIGALDSVTPSADGTARVRGWTLDPDTSEPITIVVQVDGVERERELANLSRPDVGAAHGRGDLHGFDVTVPIPEGTSSVCVWAKDAESGAGVSIGGCPSVTRPEPTTPGLDAPKGAIDTVRTLAGAVAGPVVVSGWGMHHETAEPVRVALTVNGTEVARTVADLPRPDLETALGNGELHGFSISTPLEAGTWQVCAQVLDPQDGTPTQVACQELVLDENHEPEGAVEKAAPDRNSTIRVYGWALDRNTDDPVEVTVTVDGEEAETLLADAARPDIARQLSVADTRGFDVTIPAQPGAREVCVLASDSTTAEPSELRCATVVVGPHRRVRGG